MAKKKINWEEMTEDEIAKYRFNFIRSSLRRATYRWPWRNIAAKASKRGRNQYECAKCKAIVGNKEKWLDHREPIVRPGRGFVTWGEWILNAFPAADGWQVLCAPCHGAKTARENEQRKAERAEVRRRKAANGTIKHDSPSGNGKGNGERKG